MRIPEAFFVIINPTVQCLLRSPLHAFWSGNLMLITFVGRKSKKQFTTPIRYLRRGDEVWAFTGVENKWWRNLTGGADVVLRIDGADRNYRADVLADAPEEIRRALEEFLAHFPQDAPYYEVGIDRDGRPLRTDVERAATQTVWVKASQAPGRT
jgi:deazaflavin-dependent oxidoreductase (nitroreductase family)